MLMHNPELKTSQVAAYLLGRIRGYSWRKYKLSSLAHLQTLK